MKGYIIVSIGNSSDEDYICVKEFGGRMRKVFLKKRSAVKFCKELQKQYDEYDPKNLYEFSLEEVDIVTE